VCAAVVDCVAALSSSAACRGRTSWMNVRRTTISRRPAIPRTRSQLRRGDTSFVSLPTSLRWLLLLDAFSASPAGSTEAAPAPGRALTRELDAELRAPVYLLLCLQLLVLREVVRPAVVRPPWR